MIAERGPVRRAAPLILVLHGPSLSALGTREPALYGTTTLRELDARLRAEARALGVRVRTRQTNHEGTIIDELLGATRTAHAVVLNAAAYSHTSLAIADAIRAIAVPVVEVHLTNTASRESERRVAVVGAACHGRVEGFGATSYLLGLRAAAELVAAR